MNIWESHPEGLAIGPEPDLTILADGLKHLGPRHWKQNMLFVGAEDQRLFELTGTFPSVIRSPKGTHPLFVIRTIGTYGHKVCPCSSKDWGTRTYIRKGCRLEITSKVTDRTSYLVESCSFNLPLNPEFSLYLSFMGLVPESCLGRRL